MGISCGSPLQGDVNKPHPSQVRNPMKFTQPFAVAFLLAATCPSLASQVDRDQAAEVESDKLVKATYADILSLAIQGYRPSNIEVVFSFSTVYSGAYVKNEGIYNREWTLYVEETYAALAQSLIANNRRPVDIERYELNGQVRFAALAFKNVGAAQKTWNWFMNVKPGEIAAKVNAVNGRPIDIEPYSTPNGTRFSVISIRNVGNDAKAWWAYAGTNVGAVQSHMQNHGSRVYDYENYGSLANPETAVIMVRDKVVSKTVWSTLFQQSFDDHHQLMGRISNLESRGFASYAVTIIDNLNPFQGYGRAKFGTKGLTRHSGSGIAMTGTKIKYTVDNLWPFAPAAWNLGFSRTSIPLDMFGAPGCRMFVQPVSSISLFAGPSGQASVDVQVPLEPTLHGLKIQTQMLGIDPGLNALNLQTSNGLETTLRHW